MRQHQVRLGVALVGATLTTLFLVGIEPGTARTTATGKECIKADAFSENLVKHGGISTAIPAAGFLKARLLLEQAPDHPRADTAYFEEMADGSSGIAFAEKGCLSALWLAPPFVSSIMLKQMLFEGRPPERAPEPNGVAPAVPGEVSA